MAAKKIAQHPFSQAVELDVTKEQDVSKLVRDHDLVVSLLPATMHMPIAKLCIEHKKDLVTASYVSPAMRELEKSIKEANLTFVNEVGLDPGLDHMSALKIIREVFIYLFLFQICFLCVSHSKYRTLFTKFEGMAIANNAYIILLCIVEIPGDELLLNAQPLQPNPFPAFALEVLPNRNSLQYLDEYGIPHVHSMFRGTLRYKGFSKCMAGFRCLGLLSERDFKNEPKESWVLLLLLFSCLSTDSGQYLGRLLNGKTSTSNDTLGIYRRVEDHIKQHGTKMLWDKKQVVDFIESAQWLGLFGSEELSNVYSTPLQAFCSLLQEKLAFGPDERDMVLMYHRIISETADKKTKAYESSLVCYGNHEYSAMARTVGFPVGVVSQMLLNGMFEVCFVLVVVLSSTVTHINRFFLIDGKLSGKLKNAVGLVSGHHPLIGEQVLNEGTELGITFNEKENLDVFAETRKVLEGK
ncbi:saccharopine dehydrogenase [Reticulomyxa filosa]|uniref:Saccharopine dehydrogenase n=1 Tax=Reticulomyxa filosa TaxID=46433 RepID=X6NNN6_RETFI|nr:saccharopine dehydrogenase [Reticulomyxa filosa]|eukprot:ETO26987.1 saccharopine dehydrogenase [Reticulomyxa filosa]